MEVRTNTSEGRTTARSTFEGSSIGGVEERLATLLEVNAAIALEQALFHTERERMEAAIMKNPLPPQKVFSYFGLMISSFIPSAILGRLLWDGGGLRPDNSWILILILLTISGSAVTGYTTGKLVGRTVAYLHKVPFSRSIVLLPLLGLIWGMTAGAAGGAFMFLIGAFFGAVVGGAVGAVALPAFAILHRLLQRGEMIETKHFLPLAFGVTLTICSLIMGL